MKLAESDVTGMCHISEASDKRVKELNKLYEAGDIVKAFVLKLDPATKRVSLSLKASRFKGAEVRLQVCNQSGFEAG